MFRAISLWAQMPRLLWKLGPDRNLANHFDLDTLYATPRIPAREEADAEISFLNRRNFDPQVGQGARSADLGVGSSLSEAPQFSHLTLVIRTTPYL